jgi:hypothetical protein
MADFEFLQTTKFPKWRSHEAFEVEIELAIDLSREAVVLIRKLEDLSPKQGKLSVAKLTLEHFKRVRADVNADAAKRDTDDLEDFIREKKGLADKFIPEFTKYYKGELKPRVEKLAAGAEEKLCSELKKAIKTAEQDAEKSRKAAISEAEAFDYYMRENGLKFSVASKFFDDHIIKQNLSKKQAEEEALSRYKKNKSITTSSWLELAEKTVIDKASQARSKRACTHQNGQQIAIEIKARERVVKLEILENVSESHKDFKKSIDIGDKKRAKIKSEENENKQITVIGKWDPYTGEAEVYHYEAKGLPSKHVFLDKYLIFHVDGNGRLMGPAEKK